MPRVTVLTTLYNKGPYVEDAVRSVLASAYTDFELLVIDDASTDDGPARVAAFTDPRVRMIRCERNSGRPAAANLGFQEAKGAFIAVLDADDVMRPDRIEKQVRVLDADPEAGVVGTSLAVMDRPEEVMHWAESDDEAKGKLLFSDPVCYGTAMFRRSLLVDHGLRCNEHWLRPGMDYIFLLSLAPHTRFANIREPLTLYRMGEQNMRHGRDPVEDRAATYREAFRIFGIEASEAELQRQLMLHGLWKRIPGAADVRELRSWMNKLKRINRERGLFPIEVFESELERRWMKRFHALADASFLAGLAHLRLSGPFDSKRMRYLIGATAQRWLRPAGRAGATERLVPSA
ncbi:MAG: glycosyltransferase family 2 protein [Flavobacteriales bacterium]|nr:glycosyltransferase family 2 protein [Flavobacteriales bacterium]